MQGPMIGAAFPTLCKVWVRVSGNFEVQLEYAESKTFEPSKRTDKIPAEKSGRYIVTFNISGLKPCTTYYYRLRIDGKPDAYLKRLDPFTFTTAPAEGAKKDFSLVFGSCVRYMANRGQPVWTAIEHNDPDLMIWMGDNMYGDALDPDILFEEYMRQRDVESVLPVIRNTSNLAIWDDHDFGLNNHDRRNPIKEKALKVFEEVWANPAYGEKGNPGVYFDYSYGDVDLFFIDCRYYRDPNEEPGHEGKTMLGIQQYDWLTAKLQASTATFKLILSGSGWSAAKGPGGDSWASYLHERDQLFEFIRKKKISGVVLLSGDTHVGELNAIPWSQRGGYDYYDLVSSPLAQPREDSWMERNPEVRIRPVYFNDSNFGLIEFYLEEERPYLKYTLKNTKNEKAMEPLTLYADDLQNGVKTWAKNQITR